MKEVRDPLNILFFFDNFEQDSQGLDSESVQNRILEEVGDGVVEVSLSMKDFKEKIELNETRPINNCLSVISVPANQVMADENDSSKYFLGDEEKRTTENFQIHYSLIFRDWDSFLKGHFLRMVHKPYANLYQLISQNAWLIRTIEEIDNIFKTIKPSKEKTDLSQLISSSSVLNPLMLYKQLKDNTLQDPHDRLLIQGMLNVMAFSIEFCNKTLDSQVSFKASLLSFFNTNSVDLPSVVNEIVVDYLADEVIDLVERRACAYF